MTPLVQAIIVLAAQYGPEFVTNLIAVLKKPDPTVADVEQLFAAVKPYSAYGIPASVTATPPGVQTLSPPPTT